MNHTHAIEAPLPGESLDPRKMPGHWLLARLGKRVLRPGGIQMTHRMLDALRIGPADAVVEFAPGLGITARLTLGRQPRSYTAVERDQAAAQHVRRYLEGPNQECRVGSATDTSLPNNSATVVYGEALLTMQTTENKRRILREAARVLKPGGRYALHEIYLRPDDIQDNRRHEIERALADAIHVGARPLTQSEWRALLAAEGLQVHAEAAMPMHLLEPRRLLQDEGLPGVLRFQWNLLRDAVARRRVLAMRRVFRQYHGHLGAMMLVATKRAA
jgi:SAM-dependent methyltransferase